MFNIKTWILGLLWVVLNEWDVLDTLIVWRKWLLMLEVSVWENKKFSIWFWGFFHLFSSPDYLDYLSTDKNKDIKMNYFLLQQVISLQLADDLLHLLSYSHPIKLINLNKSLKVAMFLPGLGFNDIYESHMENCSAGFIVLQMCPSGYTS